MQHTSKYCALLEKAGISIEAMANHLAGKGIGTPTALINAMRTGDVSGFSKVQLNAAASFVQNNPDLVQQVYQMLHNQ